MRVLPGSGIKLMSPALADRFLTTRLPGKLQEYWSYPWEHHSHDLITSQRPYLLMPSLWELGFQHMNLTATYIQSITQCYPFIRSLWWWTDSLFSFLSSLLLPCLSVLHKVQVCIVRSFSSRVWIQILTRQLETLVQNIEGRNGAEAFSLPLLTAFLLANIFSKTEGVAIAEPPCG